MLSYAQSGLFVIGAMVLSVVHCGGTESRVADFGAASW